VYHFEGDMSYHNDDRTQRCGYHHNFSCPYMQNCCPVSDMKQTLEHDLSCDAADGIICLRK